MRPAACWDTNLFIYWIEDRPPWASRVAALRTWQAERGIDVVATALTLGEVLVHPLARGRRDVAETYRRLLAPVARLAFGPAESIAFAELRARHPGLRPADAMQLACTSCARVAYFVTNDDRLARIRAPGLRRILALKDAVEGMRSDDIG